MHYVNFISSSFLVTDNGLISFYFRHLKTLNLARTCFRLDTDNWNWLVRTQNICPSWYLHFTVKKTHSRECSEYDAQFYFIYFIYSKSVINIIHFSKSLTFFKKTDQPNCSSYIIKWMDLTDKTFLCLKQCILYWDEWENIQTAVKNCRILSGVIYAIAMRIA